MAANLPLPIRIQCHSHWLIDNCKVSIRPLIRSHPPKATTFIRSDIRCTDRVNTPWQWTKSDDNRLGRIELKIMKFSLTLLSLTHNSKLTWKLLQKPPSYQATPSAPKKWPYKKGGLNWVAFYSISTSDIWPDKSGCLWWVWPYKRPYTYFTIVN
jgi:hypothetical protein